MEAGVQTKPVLPHPMSGTILSGAEIIIQVLADEGVETIFGYSGGAILPTYDAVFRYNEEHAQNGVEPMPLIVPANEQGAGFMAAGYARASGRVGRVLVTSGPGATNCVTPVRDCMADSVPIVVLCGQVPTAAIGTDAFQEAPVTAIMGSVAKHVFLVTDPDSLEATVRTAFEIARTGRPGPVVVDIPKDVQNWEGPFKGEGSLPVPGYRRRMRDLHANSLSEEQCEEFFSALAESRRPLIYAGGGVINGNAAEQLRELSTSFGVPGVTTLMGLGSFDTTHPLCLHMLGMHGTAHANYAVDDCDPAHRRRGAVRRSRRGVPAKFAPKARSVLHFDIDPSEIHKVKQADWHYVGVLGDALQTLVEHGRRTAFSADYSEWHAEIARLKSTYALNYDRESTLIQPHYVLETMSEITRGNAIISTGVGQHEMWAAQYSDFSEPRLWLTSGSMGTMGSGSQPRSAPSSRDRTSSSSTSTVTRASA